MIEKDLQTKCLSYCKTLQNKGYPIIAINQHGSAFSSRGVPDILICANGKFIAVELKVGDNKPTPLQAEYVKRIGQAGGTALVIYGFDEFKRVIDNAIH